MTRSHDRCQRWKHLWKNYDTLHIQIIRVCAIHIILVIKTKTLLLVVKTFCETLDFKLEVAVLSPLKHIRNTKECQFWDLFFFDSAETPTSLVMFHGPLQIHSTKTTHLNKFGCLTLIYFLIPELRQAFSVEVPTMWSSLPISSYISRKYSSSLVSKNLSSI